jgi:hypothetical protein
MSYTPLVLPLHDSEILFAVTYFKFSKTAAKPALWLLFSATMLCYFCPMLGLGNLQTFLILTDLMPNSQIELMSKISDMALYLRVDVYYRTTL